MYLLESKTEHVCQLSDSLNVLIFERDYTIKNLETEEEKIKAYHLRHKIFSQELGWLPKTENAIEMDSYDKNAVFLGVVDRQNNLSAFMRIIMPGNPFMIDKEFLSLVDPEYKIRRENDTAEISRLCLSHESRKGRIFGNFGACNISMLLYKGLYHWCLKNGIMHLYFVVERKIHRLLCSKGFPCKLIGEPKKMPDGVIALAAVMDWREFDLINTTKRPEMFEWFIRYQSSHSQLQLQQPEPGSRHRAYA